VFEPPAGRFPAPRYRTWSTGVERQIASRIAGRISYLRKRGGRGFTYMNDTGLQEFPTEALISKYQVPVFDRVFRLTNDRRDSYDALEMSLRQAFGAQYEWTAAYTRSRALSNSVVDVAADDPAVVSDNAGPMPWDMPHRLVAFGYLPLYGKNWASAFFLEMRSGYPFSIQDEDGRYLGQINERRLPTYFNLNFHIERRLVFAGYRWALRVGSNNITDHFNPTLVNGNTASANFLQYYGNQRRTFNFRIRWLGRAKESR
jgi:hypothetical protein